ncbi:MAG: methyl-accepting chemotaxis protein [Desmonostoc geniculatum HA4340-LM1]|jgi:methyl-accepting chemotaxis protein WspA|nr:methyl-accepting chemotaxis protein [Desmonostoc geniculatum HA4340-LM1]
MLKNLSLQKRLIVGFLFIGLMVLVVGIVGWIGSTRMNEDIKTFSDKTFPSTVNLWKVKEAQTRVQASENTLLSPVVGTEYREKEITKIKTALQDMKKGWESYEKLSRDSEEDRIYQKVLSAWDKWSAVSEQFLRLNDQYMSFGLTNPRKVQQLLLQQGKANTPEFTKTEMAIKVDVEMVDFAIAQLEPRFDTAAEAIFELLTYNANLADKAQRKANFDAKQTNLLILICLIICPIIAIVFGLYFSKPIVQKLSELVKISQFIANSNSTGQMELLDRQDEIDKLQTAFSTVASKMGELVNTAQKISSGDLTIQIQPSDSQDEIGKLQNAFYTMNKNLNALIRRVQQSGVQITTSSTQIAASGKQLEATVTEQLASTNEVAATAQEIAATSRNLVNMMKQVAELTKITATGASESRDELQEMQNTMQQLTEASQQTVDALRETNDALEQLEEAAQSLREEISRFQVKN